MMIYYAVLRQDTEGCDHTIECGEKYIRLLAGSLDEAKVRLDIIIDNHGGLIQEELKWDEIKILCVEKVIDKIIPDKQWSDE